MCKIGEKTALVIRSWDVWDTLIARKCIHPHIIFKIVEKSSGAKGFANARVFSEQAVGQVNRNYSLDDIYRKMVEIFGIDESVGQKLKKLELDVEFDQVVPICKNLNRVKSGDILISDMYLPKTFIMLLLKKAGLSVPVELIVTSGGKQTGVIWKELTEKGIHSFHVGDNIVSDIQIPGKMGMDIELTTVAGVNEAEKFLLDNGEIELATYIRSIRLKNIFLTEVESKYWDVFLINVAMLIGILKLIVIFLKNNKYDFVGFCGRDCNYLCQLYELLKHNVPDLPFGEYIYYSRKLMRNSPVVFDKYISSKIAGKKALLIDLGGTGAHFNHLFTCFNGSFDTLLCLWLGESSAHNTYPDLPPWQNKWIKLFEGVNNDDVLGRNYYIFNSETEGMYIGDTFEVLNRAPHNSPVKMNSFEIMGQSLFSPIFSGISDMEFINVYEECMKLIQLTNVPYPESEGDKLLFLVKGLLNILENRAKITLFRERHMLDGVLYQNILRTK